MRALNTRLHRLLLILLLLLLLWGGSLICLLRRRRLLVYVLLRRALILALGRRRLLRERLLVLSRVNSTRSRHLHALLLALVSLGDGGVVARSEGDFTILLDESAAQAAVGCAAVGAAGALDTVSFADFGTFDHIVPVNISIFTFYSTGTEW